MRNFMKITMKPQDVERMFDPQVPSNVVDFCMAVVRKGFEIGHELGEKANELIDNVFDNLK